MFENEGQAEEQQQQQPEERAEKLPPERPQVVVDLSEDDADGETPPAEDKKSRRQQARDFRRQREELERQVADQARQLAELRGRFSALPGSQPVQQQQPGADPIEGEIAALNAQYDALVLAIQAPGQDQAQVMRLVDQARKIESQRRKLEVKQVLATERPSESRSKDDHIRESIEAEFPQIFNNPVLRARANAEAADLIHNRGKVHGLATAREACQRALAAFGMGQRPPAPTETERARLSGTPSRAGAGGGGTGNTYAPPPFEMELARAWTKNRKDLNTDEERWRAWSRETGNRRQAG